MAEFLAQYNKKIELKPSFPNMLLCILVQSLCNFKYQFTRQDSNTQSMYKFKLLGLLLQPQYNASGLCNRHSGRMYKDKCFTYKNALHESQCKTLTVKPSYKVLLQLCQEIFAKYFCLEQLAKVIHKPLVETSSLC